MQINRVTPTVQELAHGLQFPEGPIALPDGSVILVEMRRQTLSRVTPDGRVEIVAELGGGPNGAAVGPDGLIYVTNNGGPEWMTDQQGNTLPLSPVAGSGSIQVVEPRTGKARTLYDRCDGRPIGSPNDLVFDDHGGFWFTDFGTYRPGSSDRGGIYYARADGSRIEAKSSRSNILTASACRRTAGGCTSPRRRPGGAWPTIWKGPARSPPVTAAVYLRPSTASSSIRSRWMPRGMSASPPSSPAP